MSKFYFLLWFKWATRLIICSVLFAVFFTLIVSSYFYVSQGMPTITKEVASALFEIFQFWFKIIWNLTLLLALFRSLKYIFNNSINGFELKLLKCEVDLDKDDNKYINDIGYGDLIQVWRKWFMLNIWLVGSFMIIALVYTNFFTSYSGVFDWFNIYWLFVFILISGYISFIILGARCKRVKIFRSQ